MKNRAPSSFPIRGTLEQPNYLQPWAFELWQQRAPAWRFCVAEGQASREETLNHCRSLVSATPLPVSADLEKGFGSGFMQGCGRPRWTSGFRPTARTCFARHFITAAFDDDADALIVETVAIAASQQRASRQFDLAAVLLPMSCRESAAVLSAAMAVGNPGCMRDASLRIAGSVPILPQPH